MTLKVAAPCIAFLLFTSAVAAENCATLEACLAKYPLAASSDPGVGQKEQELAKAVQKYGAQAVPGLIKLLESSSENARQLAGYTLRDIDGLKPEHLPALMRARRNGDGWIAPAIARIGTPEAAAFLIEDLRLEPESDTQTTGALEMLGAKAAPGLAELLRCARDCNARLSRAVISVFWNMKDKAAAAVPRLLEIAGDVSLDPDSRRAAVSSVGAISGSSQAYVPQLLELKQQPLLASSVDSALASMGAPQAVPVLLQQLPVDPEDVLYRIKRLGKNGYAAGEAVQRYLEDRRWDVRVSAAETLGAIAYLPGVPALVKALGDEDDWRLVYAAVRSLAHLQAKQSLEALGQVSKSHWYPPVRELAASAAAHIESGAKFAESEYWSVGALDNAPKDCVVKESTVSQPGSQKLYADKNSRALQRLAFGSTVRSYGAAEGTEPDKNGVIEINESNVVEHVEEIQQVPHVALKVADGWLVGSDRGEWGGELVHIPPHGPANLLSGENIVDIFPLGDQFVAISGLAHMTMNDGVLLRIYKNDTGRYMAVPWKRLPAAPENSSLIQGGAVLINTDEGGSVVIDASGKIRMAQCFAN